MPGKPCDIVLERLGLNDGISALVPNREVYALERVKDGKQKREAITRNANLLKTAKKQANSWLNTVNDEFKKTTYEQISGTIDCEFVNDCWIYKKKDPAHRVVYFLIRKDRRDILIIADAWQAHTSGDNSKGDQDPHYADVRDLSKDRCLCDAIAEV